MTFLGPSTQAAYTRGPGRNGGSRLVKSGNAWVWLSLNQGGFFTVDRLTWWEAPYWPRPRDYEQTDGLGGWTIAQGWVATRGDEIVADYWGYRTPNPQRDPYLEAAEWTAGNLAYMRRSGVQWSGNNGRSWTRLNLPWTRTMSGTGYVKIYGHEDGWLAQVSGVGLFVSTDPSGAWSQVSHGMPSGWLEIAVRGSQVFAATTAGLYLSTDLVTWSRVLQYSTNTPVVPAGYQTEPGWAWVPPTIRAATGTGRGGFSPAAVTH